ncbi:uncharacterized protein EDB91DRAFT_458287 [Suillus paluster]|uniref:uncharacterized protein n=1 Tax=Suillus paluster TaxID=48578 RepID=UPI001B884861|nr:uncharacterized protein EDB91DRAFT_458287 [Suillus paluster]KAG1738403.1 hypothetical protein EDB91DRAFT_458287 [Suillus paluster]
MSWLKARDWASGVEYSSLFHSGLRAISLRPLLGTRTRAQSAAPTPSLEKTKRRCSLSSRLLKRGTSTKSPPTSKESSPPPSDAEKVVRPRPSSMFVSSTKELQELWVTGGSYLDGTDDRPKLIQDGLLSPIIDSGDLFSSLPQSRSFYVNLRDPSPLPPKEESFLSLSNDLDALYRPPRRERPLSTQTMPLPSRRFSGRNRRERRERIDPAWMLEESSPELEAQDDGENADVTEINLDSVSDWRQFHVDWLQNEPAVQLTTPI